VARIIGRATRPSPGLVGQDDGAAAAQHGVLGLGPDAVEIGAQGVTGARFRRGQRHGAVDDRDVLLAQQAVDALVHAGGQHRAFQHVDVGLGRVLGQDVAEVLEPGLQAHDAGLPQGIDRRVGHLAEVLAEEVAERTVLFRQHGQGRVVAHRADGFLALLDHGRQDHFQVLEAEAGGGLAAGQFLAAVLARLGAGADLLFEIDHVAQPVGIGVAAGQFVDDVVFAVELAARPGRWRSSGPARSPACG
jgi:hypothetical protein